MKWVTRGEGDKWIAVGKPELIRPKYVCQENIKVHIMEIL